MIRCLFLCLLFVQTYCHAQRSHVAFYSKDSVRFHPVSKAQRLQQRLDRRHAHDLFQMSFVAAPLIAGGLIVKGEDRHFYTLRNEYVPAFKYRYDDVLEYIPGMAMIGLKLGGVEGRSSWKRMLVSDAFSVAIMGSVVNGLKYTTQVMRPDGSKKNAFPSGHTAVAFMSATMLHKEYGLTRSPWYSVGGYSIATATGISRMLNNRHWLSDVLVGAGIGIISTEMGYFLADLIFKDKGIKSDYRSFEPFEKSDKPSYFGLFMGFDLTNQAFALSPTLLVRPHTGSSAGLEGAWFMNPYIGLGGRFSASSIPLAVNKSHFLAQNPISGTMEEFQTGSINLLSLFIGPTFSYPVANRLLLGTKLHIGGNYSPSNTVSYVYKSTPSGQPEIQDVASVEKAFHVGYTTNLSMTYVMKQNLGMRVFLDYKLTPIRSVTNMERPYQGETRFEQHNTVHTFTLGAAVNVMLW